MVSVTYCATIAIAAITALGVFPCAAQDTTARPESVTVVASSRYGAGTMRRKFLGSNYRDLWQTPIRVEVLELRQVGGGLRPTETGGGMQTRSLRFQGANGLTYVFRSVDKDGVTIPEIFEGSFIERIFRDLISVHFPGAGLIASPVLEAAGVLHPRPVLRVMPDDPALGDFRKEFAGRLGLLEPYPVEGTEVPLFGNAIEIIDSEKLLEQLNASSITRIDAAALLTARLTDMLLNNYDRHPGQWKWARMGPTGDSPWVPVSRDHDKVLVSYGGLLPGIARRGAPALISFDSAYPSVRGLTFNSFEFDRRLLNSLDWPAWDSIARLVVARVSDSVIDRALRNAPREYAASSSLLVTHLKRRRDLLPEAARRFYEALAEFPDVHLSDDRQVVTINRLDDGAVHVEARDSAARKVYGRRFSIDETKEIRVYLHGGNDSAIIRGTVARSIPVLVVGGNGTNTLADSSLVDGTRRLSRLTNQGDVSGIGYGEDTLFNRDPWIRRGNQWNSAGRSRGSSISPAVGFTVRRNYGFIVGAGLTRRTYGFRRFPYASSLGLLGEYASRIGATRVTASGDFRWEDNPLHAGFVARSSEFEVTAYHGLGNDSPGVDEDFYEARQRQWLLNPSIGLDIGADAGVSIGPTFQHSSSDASARRFLSEQQPYGFGSFGQVGAKLNFVVDTRGETRVLGTPRSGILVDATAQYVARALDVRSAYQRLGGTINAFATVPGPVGAAVLIRVGGERILGDAPFHDAAYLGGRGTIRTLDFDRLAGDASAHGSAELRVRLARFAYILPFEIGAFGFVDAGRVYVDGRSPGGWTTTTGAGIRLGIFGQFFDIRLLTNETGPGSSP